MTQPDHIARLTRQPEHLRDVPPQAFTPRFCAAVFGTPAIRLFDGEVLARLMRHNMQALRHLPSALLTGRHLRAASLAGVPAEEIHWQCLLGMEPASRLLGEPLLRAVAPTGAAAATPLAHRQTQAQALATHLCVSLGPQAAMAWTNTALAALGDIARMREARAAQARRRREVLQQAASQVDVQGPLTTNWPTICNAWLEEHEDGFTAADLIEFARRNPRAYRLALTRLAGVQFMVRVEPMGNEPRWRVAPLPPALAGTPAAVDLVSVETPNLEECVTAAVRHLGLEDLAFARAHEFERAVAAVNALRHRR